MTIVLYIPLKYFPEREILDSLDLHNRRFGHCALKVNLDLSEFVGI